MTTTRTAPTTRNTYLRTPRLEVQVTPPKGWEKLAELAASRDIQASEAKQVAAAVRAAVAVQECGVDPDRARDVLAALGSKVGNQLRSQVSKPVDIMAYGRGERAGIPPGVHGQVVVCAPGWTLRGRDLRRAYAAVACSSRADVDRAVASIATQGGKYADVRALFDVTLAVETPWCDLGEVVKSARHARRVLATWEVTTRTVTSALRAAVKVHAGGSSRQVLKSAAVVAQRNREGQLVVAVPVRGGVTQLHAWPGVHRQLLWQAVRNQLLSRPQQ